MQKIYARLPLFGQNLKKTSKNTPFQNSKTSAVHSLAIYPSLLLNPVHYETHKMSDA